MQAYTLPLYYVVLFHFIIICFIFYFLFSFVPCLYTPVLIMFAFFTLNSTQFSTYFLKVNKGKGVKQGCPLSPRLFTILMHYVLCKLKQKFPEISLGIGCSFKLPIILAYADDILIICHDLKLLDEISSTLKQLLAEVGLEIHPGKSELVVRNPESTKTAVEESFNIANMDIKASPIVRYLGAYLTSILNRPENVKRRCLQGTKVGKMILPFIRKNRPPWAIVRRIYSSVIVPTVVFGLNATALTARNRKTLRHFERKITQEWYKACGGSDKVSTKKLLLKRTIGKKVKVYRILYWGHIMRREQNHLLQAAYHLQLPGPKRKCRPCDTWFKTLDKELMSFNKTREDYAPFLLDRDALKRETNKLYSVADASDSEVTEEEAEMDIEDEQSIDQNNWMNL